MAQYNDIYIRDNFGDTGVIPSSGNPYSSPDIIPMQSGTLTGAQLESTWPGPDQGKPIVSPGANNIYVRGKSLLPVGQSDSGTASLYYARASLILLPNQWVPITQPVAAAPLVDKNGNQTISSGTVCAGNPPFLLTGLPPASGDHYCLVGVINTTQHQIQVPQSFPNNAAFVAWIQNNAAVGWRNISIVPNTQTQIVATYIFGSTSPTQQYFHFRLLGKGWPTNTGITAQCTSQQCPIQQSLALPAPDPQGNQITGFDAYVPGNFTASLTLTLTSPGGAFTPGATMSVTYYQYPSAERDELEAEVSRPVSIAKIRADGGLEIASLPLIQCGEAWINVRGS